MQLPIVDSDECQNSIDFAAQILDEYGDFIKSIIYFKVNDKAQAEDIYQDFFLSLISKPFPPVVRNVKGYLYRAITNDIIDFLRREEKRKIVKHKYALLHNYPVNENSPEDALIEKEEAKKFFELIIKCLPDSETRAVTLRYKNNYSIDKVANIMNVTKASASRYVCVGLKKVHHFLTMRERKL